MLNVEYFVQMEALLGDISECGDLGLVREYGNYCFLALVDVLGHGKEARKVALLAKKYLEKYYHEDPIYIMNGLHNHLRGTRGAVISLCLLNKKTGKLVHVGIGNITVRIFGNKTTRFVSKDGIVGYGNINPKSSEVDFHKGDVLLMHSDGIKEHFDVIECASILRKDAESIVYGIIDRFGTDNDDTSCIVMK